MWFIISALALVGPNSGLSLAPTPVCDFNKDYDTNRKMCVCRRGWDEDLYLCLDCSSVGKKQVGELCVACNAANREVFSQGDCKKVPVTSFYDSRTRKIRACEAGEDSASSIYYCSKCSPGSIWSEKFGCIPCRDDEIVHENRCRHCGHKEKRREGSNECECAQGFGRLLTEECVDCKAHKLVLKDGYCLPCNKDYISSSGVCSSLNSNEYLTPDGVPAKCPERSVVNASRSGCIQCNPGELAISRNGQHSCAPCPDFAKWSEREQSCKCNEPDNVFLENSFTCFAYKKAPEPAPDCPYGQMLFGGRCQKRKDVCIPKNRMVHNPDYDTCVWIDEQHYFDPEFRLATRCPKGSVTLPSLLACEACALGQVTVGEKCVNCGNDEIEVKNNCVRCPANSVKNSQTNICQCTSGMAMVGGLCISCSLLQDNLSYCDQCGSDNPRCKPADPPKKCPRWAMNKKNPGLCCDPDQYFHKSSGECRNCPFTSWLTGGRCISPAPRWSHKSTGNWNTVRDGIQSSTVFCGRSTDGYSYNVVLDAEDGVVMIRVSWGNFFFHDEEFFFDHSLVKTSPHLDLGNKSGLNYLHFISTEDFNNRREVVPISILRLETSKDHYAYLSSETCA